MNRKIVIGVALVLLLAAAVVFFKTRGDGASTFQTAAVSRGPITQAVTATGTLNPVVNVQVGSQISGIVQKLYADFNSDVKAGQTVAQIDPATFQATVTQAEGDLAAAQAQLELARLNAGRTQNLFAQKISAQADVDQATATLHQAEATVKIKQGALDKARTDLERCTIVSPIDGTVISRNVDVGQTVAASLQAPVIFTIANDLTAMQIDSNVAEADIGSVAVDQDVEFTVDAFPMQTFRGKVKQVRNAPITVQNVVSYDTVISVSNPEGRLKPGMTANVSIVAAHRDDVVKLPNAALRFRMPGATPRPSGGAAPGAGRGMGSGGPGGARGGGGGGAQRGGQGERRSERTIYVLAERGAEPKPVQIKTGISDGISTEVLEGLKDGDTVVTGAVQASGAAARPAASNNPFTGGGGRRGP
ncbi:MAG: efflux RND transporter periplasmic adaptor subunit [Verrucomicrobiota bacterium]|nr:efflux RND transporter periplasmic adaptor subunit [Verrucomicrobiota bacterium]